MRLILKKTISIFIGIILALLILEASLWIISFIYKAGLLQDNTLEKGKKYVILTVGDSFTAGIGAREGMSYPDQLESMLELNGYDVDVVNLGVGGSNTAHALNVLEETLPTLKADLVILLTGHNNSWNNWGYGRKQANNILFSLKTVKLLRLIWASHFESKKTRPIRIMEKKKFAKLMKNYIGSRGNPKEEIKSMYELGLFFLQEKNKNAAAYWFHLGLKKYPHIGENYAGMATLYLTIHQMDSCFHYLYAGATKDPQCPQIALTYYYACSSIDNVDCAINNLKQGLVLNPQVINFYTHLKYIALTYPQKSPEIYTFLQEHELSTNKTYYEIFDIADLDAEEERSKADYRPPTKNRTNTWIINDLVEIIALCRSHNVPVLMQTYPYNNHPLVLQMNDVFRYVAKTEKVDIVDHNEVFSLLPHPANYFSFNGQDAHPNETGYGLMAEVIMDFIIKESLLPRAED